MSSTNLSSQRERVGPPDERRRITLIEGETFWCLAEIKYAGKHPIDAIFQANNLLPSVATDKSGAVTWKDPLYHAGVEYILPALSQLEELKNLFWQRMEEAGAGAKDAKERVGRAGERTAVCLRWDETLWQLCRLKYSVAAPTKAIYEANGLLQSFIFPQGEEKLVREPTLYAGNSYVLPAQTEIPLLTQRYDERIATILQSKQNI
ncbi:MAG TPA: hypothetical protein V6C81_11325 [Planktothrix sp.]|jgi:hypothetical protein